MTKIPKYAFTNGVLKDGDSGRHRPGFLFHGRLHPGGPGMSDASSAGSHRLTSGQDVLRGVEVPVMPGPAGRARPLPGAQAQLREPVPARRAGLGRRVPPVDHDQVPAVPLAFVLKLAAELAPAAVRDRAGQVPVADHAGDVQVLDHDDVRRADQTGAGAVQEVPARVADLAVGAGNFHLGLGAVRRAFPAAGQPPLVAGQVPGLARQMPRVGDLPPVAGHREVRHAQIDTDRVPGRLQRLGGAVLDGEGHVPAAVRLPGHDHHRGPSAATSTSGQDQVNRSGPGVLASRSSPPRIVKARRV